MSDIKLTVDAVIFGYDESENNLKLLLIKRKYEPFKDMWALAGGYIKYDESSIDAVKRELKEETNIDNLYLEQLFTFSEPNRDPRGHTVSIAYYGLIKYKEYKIKASTDSTDVKWYSIKDLPNLSFDHDIIIKKAYERLKGKLVYKPIGFELIDSPFTLPTLQNMYETILDSKFDRGNFQRKFKKLGILDLVEKTTKGHKFIFNETVYNS